MVDSLTATFYASNLAGSSAEDADPFRFVEVFVR